ncbi:hypothetical protein KUV62_05770 [Salipiger bermudensis]|uniref:hypothetical protein n=1 Tax=Salipiger bermudensis TaxID=344736 RepID=UPI001C99C933|nr:hypothetical protein [Salipiger bermudensis]MBY6003403.1 hypothetical protein [Salipiger bermudensis]
MIDTAEAHRATQKDDGLGPLDSGLSVLFLAAFPIVLLLFQGTATSVFTAVLELVLFAAALRMIRRGQKLQNAYEAAAAARAPRLPRKIIGALLIGVMVLILAGHHFTGLLVPAAFGVLGTLLSIGAFGIDPMRDKGAQDSEPEPLATARRPRPDTQVALDRIDSTLEGMICEIAALGDTQLTRHCEALKGAVMGLIRALGEDPDGMERLHKPVVKFVKLLRRENDDLLAAWDTDERDRARRRYRTRITALGQTFEEFARKSGKKAGRDAFELEADLLWNRKPLGRAA